MFYDYDQNNSGGVFRHTDKLCEFVIVEASSPREANMIAEDLGIYFNGVDDGIDCPCCGDRWCRVYNGSGSETPKIYGMYPQEYEPVFNSPDNVYCRVFYKDGRIAEYKDG